MAAAHRARDPRPDESRAELTIKLGKHASTIWEWHNDLEKNGRISKILARMKSISWKRQEESR